MGLIKYLFLGILIVVLSSCSGSRSAHKEVMKVLDEQTAAWSRGDLSGFMQGYWHSDSLTFVGSKGVTYGFQPVLDNYIKSYPDKDAMGKLSFDIIKSKSLGRKNHLVLGKYTLQRKDDTPTGYFTIIWEKINGEWKIISDQSN